MATRGAKLDDAGPRAARRGSALAVLRGGRGLRRVLAARRRRRGRASSSSTRRRPGTRCCCSTPPARITGRWLRPTDSKRPGARRPHSSRRSCGCTIRQYTKVLLVTLAETTPVSEAAQLQADLRRARDRAVRVGHQQQPGRGGLEGPMPQAAHRGRAGADRDRPNAARGADRDRPVDDGGAGRPGAPPRPGAPRRHRLPRRGDGAGPAPRGLGRPRPNADGSLVRRAAVPAVAAGLRYTLDDGVAGVQGNLAAVGQHLPELFAATLDPRLHA